MRKIIVLPITLGFCLTLISAAGYLALLRDRNFAPPDVACARSPGEGERFRILILGESWAVGNRLFPELPDAIREKTGRPVDACAISFSGRTTAEILSEEKQAFGSVARRQLFQGEAENLVIVLNGVNDVIQHVGALHYARATNMLVAQLGGPAKVIVVSVPRVNERSPRRPLLSRIKRVVQAYLYDSGQIVAADLYRTKLKAGFPAVHTIDFDQFVPAYEGHETQFSDDGIHLTTSEFHRYGGFIGKMALASLTIDGL